MPDDDLQPTGLGKRRVFGSVLPMPGMPEVPEAALSKPAMSLGMPSTPSSPPNPFDEAISKGLALNAPPPMVPNSPLPKPPMAAAGDLPAQPPALGRKPFFSAAENNIQNPALRGLAKVGEVAGGLLLPGEMSRIPGTRASEQAGQNRELGIEKEQAGIAHSGAETAELGARGQEEEAKAQAALHPQPKEGLTPEETTIHDLMAGENGQPRINPETGKPYTYIEAYTKVKQAAQDVKPDKGRKTEKVTRVIGGVPHEVLIDAQTGDDIKDEGQTKVPGESSADKRSAAESVQVERESRQNIRKAEGKYRDTQKSVGQLVSSIDAAKDGNGLLTSFVPTMEVLGINASNGVHRISPAEAHAANLPGGWSERFNAWFDKASTGKLSPQLIAEGKALAKIPEQSAYKEYKATYDDENGIVSGYGGKDFGKRVPLIQQEGGAGVETHSSGIQIERDANGRIIGVK